MYCWKCGKSIPDDSSRCPYCGTWKIGKEKEEKNKRPKISILFSLFLAFALIVYLLISNSNSSDNLTKEKVGSGISRNYLESVGNNSYEEESVEEQYLNNSLETGAKPYKDYYGYGFSCHQSQCSGINVTAPSESDIVVIIKRNNQDGKVVQHGYICAGDTYQFDLPDGTYQTFFYYGKGWNPNKEMPGDIIGGFVEDEVFSKDNPQEIYSCILTYVLQLRRDGNFHTKSSNIDEVF